MDKQEFRQRAALAAFSECVKFIVDNCPVEVRLMKEGCGTRILPSNAPFDAAEAAVKFADALVMALQNDVESVKTKKVYLCVLLHDDGCFKAIVGCFATREDAETYSCYRKDIVIQELKVGYYGKDNL